MQKRVVSLAVAALVLIVAPINPVAHAEAPVTYTIEPWDFDGMWGINHTVTQAQLGGTQCPCVKIPYPADGWHNQQGANAIAKAPLKVGDTVMGFSLGSQVVSLYLAQHKPPAGVRFVLVGDTFARNDALNATFQGVPRNIANEVVFVANQYDGWSDSPTNFFSPNFRLAMQNSSALGGNYIHNYVNARLDDPANVVTKKGNITAVLIPTQKLPLNRRLREQGRDAEADQLDAQQRPLIDSAYTRPGPTPEQVAAATAQQVAIPPAPIHETPEPVAALGP